MLVARVGVKFFRYAGVVGLLLLHCIVLFFFVMSLGAMIGADQYLPSFGFLEFMAILFAVVTAAVAVRVKLLLPVMFVPLLASLFLILGAYAFFKLEGTWDNTYSLQDDILFLLIFIIWLYAALLILAFFAVFLFRFVRKLKKKAEITHTL